MVKIFKELKSQDKPQRKKVPEIKNETCGLKYSLERIRFEKFFYNSLQLRGRKW